MSLNFGQNLFPQRNEILVNYDWVDVAEGTGVISFDGYHVNDSTGITSKLVRTSNSTDVISISGYSISGGQIYNMVSSSDNTTATATKVLDIDFNLEEFKSARIIDGIAYTNFSFFFETGSNGECYFIVKVRKYDGSSETELGSVTSRTFTFDPDNEASLSMELDLTKTKFKAGDLLRLTIEGWTKSDGTNITSLGIAGDPSNAIGDSLNIDHSLTAGKTRIIFSCPFKINI